MSANHSINVRYKKIFEYSFEEIYIFDAETAMFVEVSPGALANIGYTMDELSKMMPTDINAILSEDACKEILNSLASDNERVAKFISKHKRKDGSLYDVEVRLQFSPEEKPVFIAMVTDITERLRYEEELKALAFRDPGTDLYNKRFFMEQLSLTIDNANRRMLNVGLVLIDMDDFNVVNNTYGHIAGDDIIRDFAKKIKTVFSRKSDIVARYGGDEFVVMCMNIPPEHLLRKCEELVKLFNEPYVYKGHSITQTASIGVAVCNGDDRYLIPEHLLEGADEAMYEAKEAGKNAIRIKK